MKRRATVTRVPCPALPVSGPDLTIEAERRALGARVIAGIDEVGRGPLAGPVLAAAVILDETQIPLGLDDSKRLSRDARERLFADILSTAVVAIGSASAREIDGLNIRRATLIAMQRAIDGLAVQPCHVLIDGTDAPPGVASLATTVVKGDARSASIAAASIVAKVVRDRLMTRLGAAFPYYGFERHVGYGTAQHLAALSLHGPCPHHRRSFAPIRQMLLAL